MIKPDECIKGHITGYDENRGVLMIEAQYTDIVTMVTREYKDVSIQLVDSRPLSAKQRRNCYAMIREISEWVGDDPEEVKDLMKIQFMESELWDMADGMFSLSNAPMSLVAAFQSFLANFIVKHNIPTKKAMLEYVDDIEAYVYACTVTKKCVVCGLFADLHHHTPIGVGANRKEMIHEGLPVMPLCRKHHQEAHQKGQKEFDEYYHLVPIIADKTICKLYNLKAKKEN